jgi:hypothetical protein
MIEKFLTLIIKELGPTGLLIVGLFFLFDRNTRNICACIKAINEELSQIIFLLNQLLNKK